MNVLVGLGVLLGCVSCMMAHMSMQYPYPRDTLSGADYAVWQQNEPMWEVHPTVCHSLDEDSSVRSGNAFAAGDFVQIDIYGSAPHDGGHCAFWWTTDESGDWHKIIDIVDCTLEDTFYVMMPYTMSTDCKTKCTFAWSWSPVSSGACEVYMNCAEISVSGVTGISSTDTDITLSFQEYIDGGNCERVSTSTHYTTIFGTIKSDYTDDDANGGATTVDTADTDDVVTVDDTDIADSIEDDSDALCPNKNAPNLNGTINNDGECDGDNDRCDDGQCCSAAGYCGPEIAYYNDTSGEYVYYHYDSGVVSYYDSASEAISDYCDSNQGDWRLVACNSTDATGGGSDTTTTQGTGDMSTTDSSGGETTSGAIQVGCSLMQVFCLVLALVGRD